VLIHLLYACVYLCAHRKYNYWAVTVTPDSNKLRFKNYSMLMEMSHVNKYRGHLVSK